jgi:hypothetical protein
VPFFVWLLEQPEFIDGRFHTTYLDEVLKTRNGRPFVEPTADAEEIAVIAAALQTVLSPGAVSPPVQTASSARWRDRARAEALRGQ